MKQMHTRRRTEKSYMAKEGQNAFMGQMLMRGKRLLFCPTDGRLISPSFDVNILAQHTFLSIEKNLSTFRLWPHFTRHWDLSTAALK